MDLDCQTASSWSFNSPVLRNRQLQVTVILAPWESAVSSISTVSNSVESWQHHLRIWSAVWLLSPSVYLIWPAWTQCWSGGLKPYTDRNQVSLLHKRNMNSSDWSWKQKRWQRCNSNDSMGQGKSITLSRFRGSMGPIAETEKNEKSGQKSSKKKYGCSCLLG